MDIFCKKLLLNIGTIVFDDDYILASPKKILAVSSTENFIFNNTQQILVDTLSE